MRIDQVTLKNLLTNKNIFLFGNNSLFIESFIKVVKKFLSNTLSFIDVNDIENFQHSAQNDLFSSKEPCFIIRKSEDKNIEQFDDLCKKHKCIFIQGHFLKSKKVSATFQKRDDILSIAFFTNSPKEYILFLLKNLGYDTAHLPTVLNMYNNSEQDPLSIIERLAMIGFASTGTNTAANKACPDLEPIPLLRLLASYIKNSYGNLDFLLNKNVATDRELLEKFLELEIDYKTKNLKSKLFIQKAFL